MINKNIDYLKSIVSALPDKPGVYQYFNEDDKIIYVGKAKNIKKRVSSYFNRTHYENNKLKVLVSKVANIKHIVVETESDALLLENNLIKKYQPRYNVLLKDDKTFPWICVKNENFARVFYTRKVVNDGSKYYGPYTSVKMVRTLIDLIKHLYKLRTCSNNLSVENIQAGKFKTCLEYHIGNCLAPCIGKQTIKEYNKSIDQIKNILKGNIQEVITYLNKLMQQFASEFKFEEAQTIKEKIDVLSEFKSKSTIVSPTINNVDVFSLEEDDKNAYVNFLKVLNGGIVSVHTLEMKKRLSESKEELLSIAITDIRNRLQSTAKEIIIPFKIEYEWEGVGYTIPQRGDKKKLLELSQRNAKYYRLEKLKNEANRSKMPREERILKTLQGDLHLSEYPDHIECFDNSNIQGSNPVGACVVFKNSKPSKKDYRHFNIKTVEGPDDFASMSEVVYRRYKRLLDENQKLPQLIIIDGGKGQLGSALKALEDLNLRGEIAIIGIAKKLEEIYFPGDSVPLYLDKNSESLKLIQNLRNEAHRFGITFHRQKRSISQIQSELDQISGIGEKSKTDLLKTFKTVSKIRKASFEELKVVIGAKRAQIIIDFFSFN